MLKTLSRAIQEVLSWILTVAFTVVSVGFAAVLCFTTYELWAKHGLAGLAWGLAIATVFAVWLATLGYVLWKLYERRQAH
jgi:uncharacterized membrane protein (DUF485 family)